MRLSITLSSSTTFKELLCAVDRLQDRYRKEERMTTRYTDIGIEANQHSIVLTGPEVDGEVTETQDMTLPW